MNILVTGGAGFIGSHTVVELLQAGNRKLWDRHLLLDLKFPLYYYRRQL